MLLLFILSSFHLQGQNVEIEWSEPVKKLYERYISAIVVGSDNNAYTAFHHLNKFYIEKYDEHSRWIYTERFDLTGPEGEKLEFKALTRLGNKVVLITTYYNRKTDEHRAYLAEIDEDGNNASRFKLIDKMYSKKRYDNSRWDFFLSNDSSKLVIYHEEPYEGIENRRFRLILVNSDMTVDWYDDLKLPYSNRASEVLGLHLTSDGRIYLPVYHTDQNINEWNNTRFILYSYENKKNGLRPQEIKPEGKVVLNLTTSLDKEENVVCAGLYSNDRKYRLDGFDGVFYMTIAPDNKSVKKVSTKTLMPHFKNRLLSKNGGGTNGTIYYYNARRLLFDDSGSTLVAEYNSPFGYCYDILVTRLDNEGNILWMENIPKRQMLKGKYASFSLMEKGDKLYFFYNDLARNADTYIWSNLWMVEGESLKNEMLMVAVMDKNTGDYTKYPLIDYTDKESRYYFNTWINALTHDKEMVIYGDNYGKSRYGRVKIR